MESIMDVSPGLIIWSLINFIVLYLILAKFAFPALKKSLKGREENIQKSIDEANAINEKAKKLYEESQAKLDNAHKEMSEIIASGKERADQQVKKATEEAEKIKKQKVEEAKREIDRSKDEAISQLRSEVADLVVMATEKILEQKLDKDEQLKMAQQHIEKLPKN